MQRHAKARFLFAVVAGAGLAATAFAQQASEDDRAVLAAVQRPISLACITVPVGRPLWKDVPSWFLVAEHDRMIIPDTQRYMAERMKAKIKAHAVDHTPGRDLRAQRAGDEGLLRRRALRRPLMVVRQLRRETALPPSNHGQRKVFRN